MFARGESYQAVQDYFLKLNLYKHYIDANNYKYGGIFGLAVHVAMMCNDIDAVKNFLPFVMNEHIDKVFPSFNTSPEIMKYIVENRVVSESALIEALALAVTVGNINNIEILLQRVGIQALLEVRRDLPLVQHAVFYLQPDIVRLLVKHLVRHGDALQRQSILNESLIILADNKVFVNQLHMDNIRMHIKDNLDKILKIARILLENGANLSAQDEAGNAIQHAQAHNQLPELVRYLKLMQRMEITSQVAAATLFNNHTIHRRQVSNHGVKSQI